MLNPVSQQFIAFTEDDWWTMVETFRNIQGICKKVSNDCYRVLVKVLLLLISS